MFMIDEDDEKKVKALANYVKNFVTPIALTFISPGLEDRRAIGTGTFFTDETDKFLVSNYHVYENNYRNRLTGGYEPDKKMLLSCKVIAKNRPLDVALDCCDNLNGFPIPCLPMNLFQSIFDPIEGEYLYGIGFPASMTDLNSNQPVFPFAVLTDEWCPEENEPDYKGTHFRMRVNGLTKSFGDMSGFSGTLIWDTRIKKEGASWTPEKAVLAGIVCKGGVDELDCTRVECMCISNLINYWRNNKMNIAPKTLKLF